MGYLARHFHVVTFDGRGCGKSDRPTEAALYADDAFAEDAIAVLDAVGVDRAVLVGFSCGVTYALHAAARHPERVAGLFGVAPACGLGFSHPEREVYHWDQVYETTEGWAKYNRDYWRRGGYPDFLRVLHGAAVQRAALDEADRGHDRVRARCRPRDRDRLHRRSTGLQRCHLSADRADLRCGPLPGRDRARARRSDPSDRDRPPGRRADRWSADRARGCRSRPDRPRTRADQHRDPCPGRARPAACRQPAPGPGRPRGPSGCCT